MFQAKYVPYYIIVGLVVVLVILINNRPEETEDPKLVKAKAVILEQKKKIEFWKEESNKWMERSDDLEGVIEKNKSNVKYVYEKHKKIRNDIRLLDRSERVKLFADRYKRR